MQDGRSGAASGDAAPNLAETATDTRTAVLDTPVGPLTVAWNGNSILRVRFNDPGTIETSAPGPEAVDATAPAQLLEYFAGQRRQFDVCPHWSRVDEPARHVLRTLTRIAPFGTTVSYGELATASGLAAGAARQVGGILGANPWPVLVPCHRVLMADGSLGGFGGGLWRKELLLQHEGVLPATLLPLQP